MTICDFKQMIIETKLNLNNCELIDDGGGHIEYYYQLMPDDFIKFAELDLKSTGPQRLVNALCNAKRAIDCRTDLILDYFGIELSIIKRDRYEVLNYLGIVAPRILTKIRKARNLLEHEYKVPNIEIVEDALDIAAMFESSAKNIFKFFPETVYFGNTDYRDSKNYRLFGTCIEIRFSNKAFDVRSIVDDKLYTDKICTNKESDLYLFLMKSYIAAKNEYNEEITISELFEKIDKS